MKSKADKTDNENQGRTTKAAALQKSGGKNSLQMEDNREVSSSQAELQMMIDHSPSQMMQREKLQRTFDMPIQRQGPEEEEELMQGKFAVQRTENKTGLPDNLKTGIENLSGLSLDDVRVHGNSSKPGAVNAHAYTQGTDIHVAPGQMKHLPHEAWHAVQQAQGRVKPTVHLKDGVRLNDEPALEREADVMGANALRAPRVHSIAQLLPSARKTDAPQGLNEAPRRDVRSSRCMPIQLQRYDTEMVKELERSADSERRPFMVSSTGGGIGGAVQMKPFLVQRQPLTADETALLDENEQLFLGVLQDFNHETVQEAWNHIRQGVILMREGDRGFGQANFEVAANLLVNLMAQQGPTGPLGLALWSGAGTEQLAVQYGYTVLNSFTAAGILTLLDLHVLLPNYLAEARPLWSAVSRQLASQLGAGEVIHIFAAVRHPIDELVNIPENERPVIFETEMPQIIRNNAALNGYGLAGITEVWHVFGRADGDLYPIGIDGDPPGVILNNMDEAIAAMWNYYRLG